ncbi:MAG: hypothetical protein QXN44_00820 [Candidatus Caldarchaeum sp.]
MATRKPATLALALMLVASTVLLPTALAQNADPSLAARLEAVKTVVQKLKSSGLDTQAFEKTISDVETALRQGSGSMESGITLEKIHRQLTQVSAVLERDRQKAVKAYSLLSIIHYLRPLSTGFSAVLLDVSEQLVEQALKDRQDVHPDLLPKAQALVDSVRGVFEGKPINLKVVRSADAGGEETEISIASLSTANDVVRVFMTEERLRYSNNTVVVSKNAFISLGSTIIIQKETTRNVEPASEKTVLLGENKAIGAVLSLSRQSNKLQLEKTEYDVAVLSHSFEQNHVRLVLSSTKEAAGKLVIIDVDKDFMKNYLPRDISIRVDGTPAVLAQSITEILTEDSTEPKYFLALTGRGLQIVLYIPNWSTKVVIIGSASSLSFQIAIPGFWNREFELFATTVGFMLLMAFVFVAKVLRRTLDE